jgi:hypothetical protein
MAQVPESDWIPVRAHKARIISKEKAYRLQKSLDIAGLATFLLSDESQIIQREGWGYSRVVKKEDVLTEIDENRTLLVPIGNKWGDCVLFTK